MTSRFSGSENSRATPCMSCNRGPVSSYFRQVRPKVGEDGSDYPSDISRGGRRGVAPPERQFHAASIADGRTGEGEKLSRNIIGRMVTTGRPGHASACSLSRAAAADGSGWCSGRLSSGTC